MRGETVVVKDVSGRGVLARVWDTHENSVCVIPSNCNESMVYSGQLFPLSFPLADVYKFDPINDLDEMDWATAALWLSA